MPEITEVSKNIMMEETPQGLNIEIVDQDGRSMFPDGLKEPYERTRKLIQKIDEALMRIEDGSYGYCEETGEPISLKRLEARPIATLSIEAQERHERMERTHRED